jgi:hypothetical protein
MSNEPTTKMPIPKVVIDRMALEKIRYFVNKDSQECSGMGITRVVGDTIYVDDIQMLEQRNGAAHTDINEQAVTKLMYDWRDRQGEVNFWWHSHVNMGVFWSTTDEATIKQLAQHGMCVASVFNKKGEIRTAVACKIEVPFSDKPEVVTFDNLQLMTLFDIPEETKKAWDEEHTANVKKFSWQGGGHQGGLGFHRRWDGEVEFFPVPTTDPDYWDDSSQGAKYDTNWHPGSHWDAVKQKWKKSKDYLDQYAAWASRQKVLNGSNASTPSLKTSEGLITGTTGSKWKFAEEHDEIVRYDAVLDMFELNNGRKISADWYMSDLADQYRNVLKSDTKLLEEQIREYEESLAGKDSRPERMVSEAEVQAMATQDTERMTEDEIIKAYYGGYLD